MESPASSDSRKTNEKWPYLAKLTFIHFNLYPL
jgi:hypothetical protein